MSHLIDVNVLFLKFLGEAILEMQLSKQKQRNKEYAQGIDYYFCTWRQL